MTAVLASEWLKLRSVRSTAALLAAAASAVLLAGLLAWSGAHLWDGLTPARRARMVPMPVEQTVLPLVQLSLAVLGVLAITAEYASGAIRASLVAVPGRLALLAAKAQVVGAVALAAGEALTFAAFAAGRSIMAGRPLPGNTAPLPGELPLLLASGLSVAAIALVGLGLGAVLRSSAGTIVAIVLLMVVLPVLAHGVPAPWGDRLGSVLLPGLAVQVAGQAPGLGAAGLLAGGPGASPTGAAALPPLAALALLLAYPAAALGAGALAIVRRDA